MTWQDILKRKKKKARRRKKKSNVNAAGNYTKPTMRAGMFRRIKAQLLAQRYKKAGGGYRD